MRWLGQFFFSFCTVCKGSRSKTVRLAFPLTFVAIAFLGAQAITSQGGSTVTVVPTTNSLREGEPFSLDIYVNAHTEVNAVNLEIDFPTDQMRVTGIDTGESVITLWTVDPYVDDNKVILRGGTFRRGFKGEHLIATINAEATETGIADISVSDQMLLAGDGAGTTVAVKDTGSDKARIYITNQDGVGPQGASDDGGATVNAFVEIKIATDIDGDGEVSLADVSRFMSAWFSRSVVYDFNGDGRMTFRDFGIILSDSFFK